ncbi:hypothetical protein Trydic_g8399 [Trypoxylus dichotomus]
MSHSVVKVTENKPTDSLLLVVSEDGTITPDKEEVESYLNSRSGVTELQVMHVNKFDDNNIDVTLDTLMYVHSEEIIEEEPQEMDQIARNLMSFRMDHDYTPLTSPKHQSPVHNDQEIDELAQTLSILEGTTTEEPPKIPKITKTQTPKMVKKPVQSQQAKPRARMINTITVIPAKQQSSKVTGMPKVSKPKITEQVDSDDCNDDFEDIDYEDDDNDSDFELDDMQKMKSGRKPRSSRKQKKIIENTQKVKAKVTVTKQQLPKAEDIIRADKVSDSKQMEVKQPEKKTPQKKEKKIVKPPDDFALFSAPDIIRRVGGKEATTPTTPTMPESPKTFKPAKIHQDLRGKSLDSKPKRASTESKSRSSTEDYHTKRLSSDKPKIKIEKIQMTDKKNESLKAEGTVSVQRYDETIGSSSNESALESQLEPLPSAEDIRSIIQNENTKSFTSSLVIPDSHEHTAQVHDHNSQANLDSTGLELDQSILDNINTDLISEDILYQVAQSLVDNPELQNVIDKSIVDGNLMLDSSLQSINQENTLQHAQMNNTQSSVNSLESQGAKGTQIIRSDGRVLVLPPIERPTTRSRNKPSENPDARQVTRPMKPLDEEHVSGNELDSSNEEQSEEDESEDDPNKLWCICNQPHNNRFMICCDTCEEWYHGKCVNVTKAMGQMMEQDGKEWICLYCKDPSLKRPSAAARRIRKASRTSTDSSGSQRRASTGAVQEPSKIPGCIVCGKPSRNSSIYCSDSCILKHAQGVEKVVVFERKTGKILSGSNAPSAANLDKWLADHPGFEVVRSTSKPSAVKKMSQSKLQLVKNTSNDGVSLAIQRKGINIGVLHHQPKHQGQTESNRLHKKITGLKIISKVPSSNQQKQTKLIQPVPVNKAPSTTTPIKSKPSPLTKSPSTPPAPKEKPMPQKTPKARQAEIATTPQPKTENIRENVRKTLMEQLTNRIKMADDLKLTDDEVANISTEIENQLFKCFGDTGQKYRNKYRSLIFNIKDIKNQTLWRRICEKSINPYQLVRLSPDDLASQELALWREREAKHQLDMIKKSELELLNCNRQYVFKTHKGEQVFEDDRPTDQTVTEVITGLGTDGTSTDKEEAKKESSKDKDRKSTSSKHKKDRSRDKERKSNKEKGDSKDRRKEYRSTSKDKDRERDRRKRSRSREHNRHAEMRRSRSRDRDRRKRSHKSSKHKKDVHNTTEKLDKKSKEILEQLVDKQIVPPLEDRLWKHVPQEDIVQAANVESDSDHEPTSTVTIPTPPRSNDPDEPQSIQATTGIPDKNEKKDISRSISIDSTGPFSPKDDSPGLSPIRPHSEHVWKGTINMVDVAQISITAHEVSGDCSGLSDELPSSLDIVGRISPDTVWDYIGKMKCSNSKMISLLRLNATNIEEKMPYIALYSYLSSRGRLGVVKSTNKAVKDFYIFPLGGQTPIPQALLPINGPGFEESRPPLLVGVIVRDKRKRPMIEPTLAVIPKKIKVDIAVIPPGSSTPPISTASTPSRSYTPPPSRDPRIKTPYTPTITLPTPPINAPSPATTTGDDMDEPYSPEDSDPEVSTPPLPLTDSTRLTNNLPVISNATKQSSFIDNPLPSQTFKPFSSKFESIPGLEDPTPLPSNSIELQRKMAELDQRIAMHKAEIDNMSQDLVSATASDIGTSALANIALPSNLQQILDSIKTIGAVTNETVDVQTNKSLQTPQSDLTIPLMLPKISSRPLTGSAAVNQKTEVLSPTIPLNLPKIKKHSATNSPQRGVDEKSTSVLSSLSEEDLIRKAEEMLSETEPVLKKSKEKELVTPPYNPGFSTIYNTPPPAVLPPSNVVSSPTIAPPAKRSKIDLSQPPIPGLEDEC